jgi:CheY-like chemotaxis protein
MTDSARRTVLVVDDDALNRKLIETLLRADGHAVVSADTGAAALAAVAASRPDLLILDLMMPGMDGFEVIRRLRATPAGSRLPILMVTALDDPASRARLAAAGIERVLTKPVDRWQLKAQVAAVFRDGGEND